jgi:hypothetical protein
MLSTLWFAYATYWRMESRHPWGMGAFTEYVRAVNDLFDWLLGCLDPT